MQQVRTLTGLRGWAALWVFFYHATYDWAGDSIGMKIARQGFEGVVVFFVLSGFILSYVYAPQLATGGLRVGAFLRARVARIYPLHLFVLLAYLALAAVGLLALSPTDSAHVFLLNLFLVQAWGFIDAFSWNQPAWSISVEAFAYLLFPALLLNFMRVRRFVLVLYAAAIAYWLYASPYKPVIAALVTSGWIGPIPPTAATHFLYGLVLLPFLAMFVAGVLLFRVVSRQPAAPSRRWAYDLAVATGGGALAYICLAPFPEFWFATAASVLIVAGLYGTGVVGSLLFGNPFSVFLGEISYALYLSHFGAKTVLDTLFGGPLPLWLLLPAALLIATTLHYGIERPARTFLRGVRAMPARIRMTRA